MNRMIKFGCAALVALSLATGFAEETKKSVGWTPIAVSLASPVQVPWGHCDWDVYGLDLGILYNGSPKVYGLDIASIANYTTDDLCGLEVSGLLNWNAKDAYGARFSLGANLSPKGSFYGFEAGAFSYQKEMWGVDVEFLGTFQDDVWGWQISGLVNLVNKQSYGFQTTLGVNVADVAYGCQLAGIFNLAQELHGAQIGIVNFADNCEWGFQIGIVNIIMSNQLKVLPIINFYF